MKVTKEAKTVEKSMLPKKLAIISAKKVITVVLCLSRIWRLSMRESAELSAICEEAKAWAGIRVSIIGILVMDKEMSMTRILMVGLIIKK